MKTFAATAIFQVRVLPRWRMFSNVRRMSRMAEALAEAQKSSNSPTQLTFEAIGLQPHLASAVRAAFPKVKFPTATQAELIPAIENKKDVILQDEPGSGKTLSLVLAALNKPRLRYSDTGKQSVTTLFLVPHRDLALQIRHWIQRITEHSESPPPLEEVAQVLLRDGNMHLESGMQLLSETPPHVLIATPAGLLDVLKKGGNNFIDFSRVSAVVVDEVDYLIETVPALHGKLRTKVQKRIEKHPGPARELLDIIYSKRKKFTSRNREEFVDEPYLTPQLILSSATVRRHLKDYFFGEGGYLKWDAVKVRGRVLALHEKQVLAASATHTNISHHVLVVSDESIENIPGALEGRVEAGEIASPASSDESEEPFPAPVKTEAEQEREMVFSMTPSPYNQNSLEAVAAAFALYVPSVALFIIPGGGSIHRAVYDLRALGVNALDLDMLKEDKGRLHLLSGGAETVKTTPTLLVTTVAAMRGLDLPELQHLFILGTQELEGDQVTSRTLDSYIHMAGRVGRFGKKGTVISVIEPSQGPKMTKILGKLGIPAVKLKQFP
ncbi:hypothetical protein V5O48_003293 [Marasmius crinis-equi]|uniref:ATP-dependent RNA helicase n=1 Tax=Marasmius crinis-equi TaxID=585013 RepID=A0ABR3FTD0_9AGAR